MATGVQRPSALGSAQNEHLPVQAELQQTPSAQNFDVHCAPAVHGCPSPRSPQLPFLHTFGGAQSALDAHMSLQAPPEQIDGAQLTGDPATHVPLPSQLEAGTRLPLEQAAGLHTVPETCLLQPPSPLHIPLPPHVSGASFLHIPCGSATPAFTGLHSPIIPGWLQLTHAPVQARLQHTPSAQKPEPHSSPQAQARPIPFLTAGGSHLAPSRDASLPALPPAPGASPPASPGPAPPPPAPIPPWPPPEPPRPPRPPPPEAPPCSAPPSSNEGSNPPISVPHPVIAATEKTTSSSRPKSRAIDVMNSMYLCVYVSYPTVSTYIDADARGTATM